MLDDTCGTCGSRLELPDPAMQGRAGGDEPEVPMVCPNPECADNKTPAGR